MLDPSRSSIALEESCRDLISGRRVPGQPVVIRGTVATSRSRGGRFKEKTMIQAIAGAVLPQLLGGITGGNSAGSSGGGLLGDIAKTVAGPLLGGAANLLGAGKLF